MASKADVQAVATELPAMPLTLEGYSVLHQMFRFRWAEWRKLDEARQAEIAREVAEAFSASEEAGTVRGLFDAGAQGRPDAGALSRLVRRPEPGGIALNRTGLQEFLEPVHSYLSVIELGLYDSSVKLFQQLTERGLVPLTEEWNKEVEETMERQRQAMKPRLFPKIPTSRYLCFYPMDRRAAKTRTGTCCRSKSAQRQMEEHGMVGPPLRGQGAADHHRVDRLRRLGVGRGSVRARSAGVQEADLRNALRPGQRGVCAVRAVLRGVAGSAGEAWANGRSGKLPKRS